MAELEIKEPTMVKVSEVNAKAAEIKAKRALPEAPGKTVKFSELQQWLALLSPDAEDRVTIWVYRRDPIINRQLLDPNMDNNIDIFYNGFNKLTEDYVKEHHGGGSYKFVIKDEDKPKEQKGGFFEATLTIDMVDCPPKLELREVEWDNPRNKGFKSWCRARKMINENNMPTIEKKEGETNVTNGVDANMLKMMLDFTAKMSDKEQIALKQKIGGEDAVAKSMNELFLEKLKQEDPNKQMSVVVSLITAMKQMQPEIKADNTLATIMPMFMAMFQQMNESANRQMTLLVEMLKANKSEPKEEGVSKIEELRSIIEIAREIKGGSGQTHEKTTAEVVGEILTPIIGPALTLVGNVMAINAAKAGVQGVKVDQSQPKSNMETIRQEQAMQTGQPQLPAGETVPVNEAVNLITQFEPIILNKLAGEGWEFGAWVSEGFGDMVAAGIVKYGPQKLMEAAKLIPSFWNKIQATYGEAHLLKWLESLCNYKEIVRQMEEEENGEELPNAVKEIKNEKSN